LRIDIEELKKAKGQPGRDPRGDWLGCHCIDYGLSLLHKQNVSSDVSVAVAMDENESDNLLFS
jgi:hypothetical protein